MESGRSWNSKLVEGSYIRGFCSSLETFLTTTKTTASHQPFSHLSSQRKKPPKKLTEGRFETSLTKNLSQATQKQKTANMVDYGATNSSDVPPEVPHSEESTKDPENSMLTSSSKTPTSPTTSLLRTTRRPRTRARRIREMWRED